jgi:hypothetical protein
LYTENHYLSSEGRMKLAILFLLAAAARLPLRQYRWYRKALGGRWARVSRFFHGRKWVQVHPECIERCEEYYS